MLEQAVRPTFNLFDMGPDGIRLVAERVQWFFGSENCRVFRQSLKAGDLISAETSLRVDGEVYDRFGKIFDIPDGPDRERLWNRSIGLSNGTINYARRILFSPAEKRATLTSRLTQDLRPSAMLERLMKPKRMVGEVAKFEQGRQLWLGAPCMEVILDEEDTLSGAVLNAATKYLEAHLFIGRDEDAPPLPFFSYHDPDTNKVRGISFGTEPQPPQNGLLTKLQHYPVRTFTIPDQEAPGGVRRVLALYEDREKQLESRVVKACVKSLKNGGAVETQPYRGDHLAFRLVVVGEQASKDLVVVGDRPLRDKVMAHLENLLKEYTGFIKSRLDDEVDSEHADKKIEWRRRNIYLEGVNKPIEVVVEALADHIDYEFNVGCFNPRRYMHDGQAHNFHKLEVVSEVAPYFWPVKLYGMDLDAAKATASRRNAAGLFTDMLYDEAA